MDSMITHWLQLLPLIGVCVCVCVNRIHNVYNVFTLHSINRECAHNVYWHVFTVYIIMGVYRHVITVREYRCVNTVCSQYIQSVHTVFSGMCTPSYKIDPPEVLNLLIDKSLKG